jgi:ribosomal protein L40E
MNSSFGPPGCGRDDDPSQHEARPRCWRCGSPNLRRGTCRDCYAKQPKGMRWAAA